MIAVLYLENCNRPTTCRQHVNGVAKINDMLCCKSVGWSMVNNLLIITCSHINENRTSKTRIKTGWGDDNDCLCIVTKQNAFVLPRSNWGWKLEYNCRLWKVWEGVSLSINSIKYYRWQKWKEICLAFSYMILKKYSGI